MARRHKARYARYLKTPYWRKVRTHFIKLRKECALCGRKSRLQLHHLSYKHKGDEIKHPKDMMVVCKDCHELIHTSFEKCYISLDPKRKRLKKNSRR